MKYLIVLLALIPSLSFGQGDYMKQLLDVEGARISQADPSYSMTYRFYADSLQRLYYPSYRERLLSYIGDRAVCDIDIYKRREAYIVEVYY